MSILAACERFLRSVLWQLVRVAVLLGLCWVMLQVNIGLASSSLQALGLLQAMHTIRQSLSEVVEATSESARVAQTALEIANMHSLSPPFNPHCGGFACLMPDMINLMLGLLWKPHGRNEIGN